MKLQGKQCFLRALEPHDVEHLFQWENQTEHWLVSGTKAPFSKHQLQEYLKNTRDIYADRQLRLMICTEAQPVGCIDLFDFEPEHRRAGIGILIGEDEERGKGMAKCALNLLVEYAFEILSLHQLYANVPSNNTASHKLFQSLDFEHVGTRKDWLLDGKKWRDEWMYQLIDNR